MALLLTGILALAAITAIVARRAHSLEALTILIVALPIVLFVPPNTSRWIDQLGRDHNRDSDSGRAVTPLVILPIRNPTLEQQVQASVPRRATYAVVPDGRWLARSRHGTLTYLESWFQFQFAPRLQVGLEKADWLIVLDGTSDPLLANAKDVYYLGDDRLVRR